MRSSWFAEFQTQVRSQLATAMGRGPTSTSSSSTSSAPTDSSSSRSPLASGFSAVRSWGTNLHQAGNWTAQNISSSFQACYGHRPDCYSRRPRSTRASISTTAGQNGATATAAVPRGLGLRLTGWGFRAGWRLGGGAAAAAKHKKTDSEVPGGGEELQGLMGARQGEGLGDMGDGVLHPGVQDVLLSTALQVSLDGVEAGLLGPVGDEQARGAALQPPGVLGPLECWDGAAAARSSSAAAAAAAAAVRGGTTEAPAGGSSNSMVPNSRASLPLVTTTTTTSSSSDDLIRVGRDGGPTASSSGRESAGVPAAGGGGFVQGVSNGWLGRKRPGAAARLSPAAAAEAATRKKDDDVGYTSPAAAAGGVAGAGVGGGSRAAAAAAAAAGESGGGGMDTAGPLPVSSNAAIGGVRSVGEGMVEDQGMLSGGTAVAGKPLPPSLRRRGWGGWVTGGGWVTEALENGGSPGVKRTVVEVLGQTGKLMAATTGQLLKGPGLMFQACTAQGGGRRQPGWVVEGEGERGSSEGGGAGVVWLAGGEGAAPGMVGMSTSPPSAALSAGGGQGGGADGSLSQIMRPSSRSRNHQNATSDGESDDDPGSDADSDLSSSDIDPDLGGAGALGNPDQELDSSAVSVSIRAVVAAVTSRGHEGQSGSSGSGGGGGQEGTEDVAQAEVEALLGGTSLANMGSFSSAASGLSGSPTTAAAAAARAAAGMAGGGLSSAGSVSQAAQYYSKKLESKARRQMYPVGRLLHLMPKHARAAGQKHQQQEQRCGSNQAGGMPAATAAASGSKGEGSGGMGATAAAGSSGTGHGLPSSSISAAADGGTAATASNSSSSSSRGTKGPSGLGAGGVVCEEFELLEMPNAEVYGRLVLCKSMVRDHFIPSYLKALDSVLAQLEEVVDSS